MSFISSRWAIKKIKEELPQIKVKVGEPKIEKRQRTKLGGTLTDTWKSGGRRFLVEGLGKLMAEHIKIRLLFMKKGISKNIQMFQQNILIGNK